MVLKNEYIVAGIIIALLIGSGAGYFFGQSPIAGYKEEVDRLEAENLGIRENKAQLLEENTALQDQLDVLTENITITRSLLEEIQGKLEETKKDYGCLEQKYADLINLLNITEVKGYTQSITYNITAGTNKVWTFVIPEKGILWDVEIQFSATYVGMIYSWRQGDKRGFVGSSGISLVATDHPYLPYYGPQKYLYGKIKVDYYDDGKGRLWVDAYLTTQFDQINRGGEAYFDL